MPAKDRPFPTLPSLVSIFVTLYLLLLCWSLAWGLYYSINWPLNSDAAIMHYVAWRILNGAIPYRDIFENDPPGAYLLHMFCITVFGRGDLAFRLFDLFFCALSAIGFMALGWNRSRRFAIAGALLFTVCHLSEGPLNMAERDFLMVPFLLFATYSLRVFLNSPKKNIPLFIFGLLTGYAFWIKPFAGMFVAMSVMVLMVKIQPVAQKIKALVAIGVGMLLPAVCILAWLYTLPGALPAFWDIAIHFWPVYANLQPFDYRQTANLIVKGILYFGGPLLYIFGYGGTRIAPTDKTLLIIGVAYGIFHYLVQGKNLSYHAYPFFAFMVLYSVWVVPVLRGLFWEKIILHAALLWLIISYGSYNAPSINNLERFSAKIPDLTSIWLPQLKEDTDNALQHVPATIREPYLLKNPHQAVDFMGTASGQLWSAAYRYGWVNPCRHIFAFPLLDISHSTYMDKLAQEMFHDLSTVKPLVIIINSRSWPYEDHLVYNAIDTHQPWKDFFAENYILTKETAGYKAYRVYARIQ